jgi:hypothetical protein
MAVFLATNACLDVFAFPPGILYWVMGGTGVVLFGLFFVNLTLAIFLSGRRISHLLLAVLVAFALVGGFTISSLVGNAQARWFLKTGVHEYEEIVARVIEEKGSLSAKNLPLDSIVGHHGVWGRTNEEGEVLITFDGVGTYTRSYRLYYSGTRMENRPDNSNICFFPELPTYLYARITNNWYVHLRN